MESCILEKFSTCQPGGDVGRVMAIALDIMKSLEASPYDIIGVVVAFGVDADLAKRKLGVEIWGHVKKPVATFLDRYGGRFGRVEVERKLLELYRASASDCLCPVGPIAPVGGGYVVQRPSGIYLCGDGCRELSPEPIALYEHPRGCMLYNPPLVLAEQPLASVANVLKQLKISEPELVARYLLPGLCRDLWGVYL